jgi:hypothetical protein
MPGDAARVQAGLDAFVGNGPIVVLANREPIRHDPAADGSIVVRRSASGLVTALEPPFEASHEPGREGIRRRERR